MSLVSEIRELLDESGGAVFWVTEQLYDAANEAVLDVYASLRQEYGTATITTTASTADYNIPATIMLPQYITGTGKKYFPTTLAKLEQYNRQWKETAVGYPKHWVLNDVNSVMSYPAPDATYEFVIHGVPWPSVGEIADTAEDITVASLLRKAIIRRACAELLEYTQPSLAEQFLREAGEAEHGYKVQLRNRQSHNIRRLKPGGLMTKAQSGVVHVGRRFS